jgi:hypothetical protein
MRKKLTYVFLISLLVAGSSAFAMMGEEGVSGNDFNISRSTALKLLNTDQPLEVGGHHYKVTGTVVGTAGKMFTTAPDEIIHFNNSSTYGQAPTQWSYMLDLPPLQDENGQIIAEGGDGVASLVITKVD